MMAFVKGKSGNPGGRPKLKDEDYDLVAACKSKTPEALDVIVRIMESGQSEKNKLHAAEVIIERAYGKPEQPIKADVNANVMLLQLVSDASDILGKIRGSK